MADAINSFISLLDNMVIIQCNLEHEKVLLDSDLIPIKVYWGEEWHYRRPNICVQKKRNHLGCAHTDARTRLISEAEILVTNHPEHSSATQAFISALKTLETNIINTDLQKNTAEINWTEAYVQQLEQNTPFNKKNLDMMALHIQEIAQAHRQNNQAIQVLLKSYKNILLKHQI